MTLRRLRGGEWLALAGALGLFASLFLDWFGLDRGAFRGVLPQGLADAIAKDGWTSLGWLMVALLVLVIGLGVWLAVATATGPLAQSVAAAVLTAAVASIVLVILAVRVVTQPDLGVGAPNDLIDVRTGAYLGLICAAAVAAGGWWSIADERTGSPESAYTPPPARPAPPPR